MTPQEISDYKTGWLKNCANHSTFDEDREFDAKRWCRNNLLQHQWDFTRYTDIYEHSISFETAGMKQRFDDANI